MRLRRLGARAALTVADDGVGFDAPEDLEALATGRHFGIGGMRERALLAGGDISVESAPGEGCVLSVWVPTEVVPRVRLGARRADPLPAPRSPPPTARAVPARSVPGFTWQ